MIVYKTRKLWFAHMMATLDIYPTSHQVGFDTRSFQCGEPCTNRDPWAATTKMLDPVGILLLKCLRRQVMTSVLKSRSCLGWGRPLWDPVSQTKRLIPPTRSMYEGMAYCVQRKPARGCRWKPWFFWHCCWSLARRYNGTVSIHNLPKLWTKENDLTPKKSRSRQYSAETITDVDYAEDLVLLANIRALAK